MSTLNDTRDRLTEPKDHGELPGGEGGGGGVTDHGELSGRTDLGSHPATAVSVSPTGGIASTTVQAALAELDTEKAAAAHTHAIADTTGLQTALDGKAPASHTHTASQIADSTATGRSVLTGAAADGRTALGLGSAAMHDEGPGNGLDADTVDGRHAIDFAEAARYVVGGTSIFLKVSSTDVDTYRGLLVEDAGAGVTRVRPENADGVAVITNALRLEAQSATDISITLGETAVEVAGPIRAGGGTYALEGTLDASVRPLTRGLELVAGAAGAGEVGGAALILLEKYLGSDVDVNAGHTQVIVTKKIGGSGTAFSRVGGLNIETIDHIGWNGSGVQSFAEGLHSKAIGAWSGAGRKGSVQAAVLDTVVDSADGPTDFGFVNTLEVTVRNRVKDPTSRSWATLNGTWPSDFIVPSLIFNYSDSLHPADVGLSIGNGYGEGTFYNGLLIRDGAIQTGGYFLRTPYLTVRKTGTVTLGTGAGGGDAGYSLGVVEETSSTAALGVVECLSRRSTGTVAAGFGLGRRVELEDAGGTAIQVFQDNFEWIDPDPLTRSAKWTAYVIDKGGARTLWVAASDGTKTLIGFHGSAAVDQQAIGATLSPGTAGGTYGATEQTMLQEAHDRARTITAALIACGLMKA